MPVIKMITLGDDDVAQIEQLQTHMRRALLRPVTQIEVMQEAIRAGLAALLDDVS